MNDIDSRRDAGLPSADQSTAAVSATYFRVGIHQLHPNGNVRIQQRFWISWAKPANE